MFSNYSREEGKQRNELKEALRLSRSLFVIVIAFTLTWTPYCVVIIVDFKDHLPMWVHLWVTILAHSHSSLNFFIYGLTNATFRQGFMKFLTLKWEMWTSTATNTSQEFTSPSSLKPSTGNKTLRNCNNEGPNVATISK